MLSVVGRPKSGQAVTSARPLRPSVFQAGHIPSWRGSRESYALSPVADDSGWLLLLLSPLLSAAGPVPHLRGSPGAVTAPRPLQAPPPNPIAAEPDGRRVLSSRGGGADHECNAASLSLAAGSQPLFGCLWLRSRIGRGAGRGGERVPAGAGLGKKAQAGPLGELREHVTGLDAEQVSEVASGPVESGLAGHEAGDWSLLVSGRGCPGPGGWPLRPRGRAAGRSGGAAMMVTCTRVIGVGCSGRSWPRR